MLAYFVRYMLMFGHAGEQAPRRIFGLQTLVSFGHYMLILGHRKIQVFFCDTRNRMFHVKRYTPLASGSQMILWSWTWNRTLFLFMVAL